MEVVGRSVAQDGTAKLLIELEDQSQVETVLLFEKSRATQCISTQVGCVRACTFCLTGTMGLKRNLTAEEIVGQIVIGGREAYVRNIVFMGMGEPLDNLKEVEDALKTLTEDMLFAPRHITMSTVAPSPTAVRRTTDWPCQMAWSLHAADDELRKQLIPTTRHDVKALRDAFAERPKSLFVEVALIAETNDHLEDAQAIAELFADYPEEVRINLLPMNPIETGDPKLRPSPEERVAAFQQHLRDAGFFCMRRKARGADENAACGQLVTLVSGQRVTRR